MKTINAFWRGLTQQPVDYTTRHHSRAYNVGDVTAAAALLSSPLVICFLLGALGVGFCW